jgi:hypothetical protein
MSADLYFLSSPSYYKPQPASIFAKASGTTLFYNYSQSPTGSLTSAQANTLVKGGVAAAISEALAVSDQTFSALFTDATGVAAGGSSEVQAFSETQVIASFSVKAGERFSFDFATELDLHSSEIEDPWREYAKAHSKSTFLLLDTSNIHKPKVVDYFGFSGDLVSSEQLGDLMLGASQGVYLGRPSKYADIDGNNGEDAVSGKVAGAYHRKFYRDTHLTLVEINTSAIELLSDTYLGALGWGVRYGSLWDDKLTGSWWDDKMYASSGDDYLYGGYGNDILEGGKGNDWLEGEAGDDKLHGGFEHDWLKGGDGDDVLVGGNGDDHLLGGYGNDIMVGGAGHDYFTFKRGDTSLFSGAGDDDDDDDGDDFKRYRERDVIKDFESGVDKIVVEGSGKIDSHRWLSTMVRYGQVVNTRDGTLLKVNGGELLLAGVAADSISGGDFHFT